VNKNEHRCLFVSNVLKANSFFHLPCHLVGSIDFTFSALPQFQINEGIIFATAWRKITFLCKRKRNDGNQIENAAEEPWET